MKSIALAAAGLVAVSALPAEAATILGNNTTPTLIGQFGAGTYTYNSTGIVSLTGQAGFDVDANGTPLPGSVSDPNYQYFNPSGSFQADGSFGPAGQTVKIGALAGSYDGINFFTLGSSGTLTFTGLTSLYGLVNDTNSGNNTGAFEINVSAVPEPATWAMMLMGFGMVGAGVRSRRKQSVRVTYA